MSHYLITETISRLIWINKSNPVPSRLSIHIWKHWCRLGERVPVWYAACATNENKTSSTHTHAHRPIQSQTSQTWQLCSNHQCMNSVVVSAIKLLENMHYRDILYCKISYFSVAFFFCVFENSEFLILTI